MKKLFIVLMCVFLAASCSGAAAESAVKEDYTVVSVNGAFNIRGITPEGYRLTDTQNFDQAVQVIFVGLAAVQHHRQQDIFLGRQLPHQIVALEHETKPPAAQDGKLVIVVFA